jgi:hypothetical protein
MALLRLSASISRNAHLPKPPSLFTAGTQSVAAVVTFASFPFFFGAAMRRKKEAPKQLLQQPSVRQLSGCHI